MLNWLIEQNLKIRASDQLHMTCGFRFEVRPESELVEIENDSTSTKVCQDCLVLIVVHRRVHHMKLEKIISLMAKP